MGCCTAFFVSRSSRHGEASAAAPTATPLEAINVLPAQVLVAAEAAPLGRVVARRYLKHEAMWEYLVEPLDGSTSTWYDEFFLGSTAEGRGSVDHFRRCDTQTVRFGRFGVSYTMLVTLRDAVVSARRSVRRSMARTLNTTRGSMSTSTASTSTCSTRSTLTPNTHSTVNKTTSQLYTSEASVTVSISAHTVSAPDA